MINVEYANAYKEVLEILKAIPVEDYNKIPQSKIDLFTKNANQEYNFEYNPSLTLDEQNTSKIAKTIIAILFRDYWATDEQRAKILAKEKYDMEKREQELSKKYSYNNLFANHKNDTTSKVEDTVTETAMIEYKKETVFGKIINIFKKIFGKK